MKKTCLECDSVITGRSDKKFCNDLCRNAYYNRQNSDATAYVRNVNNILRKNRRVLLKLNPNGKAKVHKSKLINEGFNFNFHTNTYTTKNGKTYYFCYDQGYLPIEDNYYALVVKQEYIDEKTTY